MGVPGYGSTGGAHRPLGTKSDTEAVHWKSSAYRRGATSASPRVELTLSDRGGNPGLRLVRHRADGQRCVRLGLRPKCRMRLLAVTHVASGAAIRTIQYARCFANSAPATQRGGRVDGANVVKACTPPCSDWVKALVAPPVGAIPSFFIHAPLRRVRHGAVPLLCHAIPRGVLYVVVRRARVACRASSAFRVSFGDGCWTSLVGGARVLERAHFPIC